MFIGLFQKMAISPVEDIHFQIPYRYGIPQLFLPLTCKIPQQFLPELLYSSILMRLYCVDFYGILYTMFYTVSNSTRFQNHSVILISGIWTISYFKWVHKTQCHCKRDHPLSTYAKFSEKLTFLTPWYVHVRVYIRGLEMLVFRNILRTYLMDDPKEHFDYQRNTWIL